MEAHHSRRTVRGGLVRAHSSAAMALSHHICGRSCSVRWQRSQGGSRRKSSRASEPTRRAVTRMECSNCPCLAQIEFLLLFGSRKNRAKSKEKFADLTALRGYAIILVVIQPKQTDIRRRVLSYREFREVTGLSKKEADSWVKNNLIRAELASNGRRRLYRLDSVVEGLIAKQLADFSSRTLLPVMMTAFRRYLVDNNIDLMKLEPNPAGPKKLIQLYTRRSKEIMPGGGLRGVMAYVSTFDPNSNLNGKPNSNFIGKNVYLIVDLIGVFTEAWS